MHRMASNKPSLHKLPTTPPLPSTAPEPTFAQLESRILRLQNVTNFVSVAEQPSCPAVVPESKAVDDDSTLNGRDFPDSGYGSISADQGTCIDSHVGVSFSKNPVPPELDRRYRDLRLLLRQPLLDAIVSKRVPTGDVSMKLKCTNPNNSPCIVIQCDKRAVKKIKKFFDQNHIKEMIGSDFLIHVVPGLRQLADQGPSVYGFCGYLKPDGSTSIKIDNELGFRMATLGGIIAVTKDECHTLYGLTAGHALTCLAPRPTHRLCSAIDSGDESDESSDSEDDGYSYSGHMTIESSPDIRPLTTALSVNIGTIAAHSSQSNDQRANYDWALVKLSDAFASALSTFPAQSSETTNTKAARAIPYRHEMNVTVMTSRGGQRGILASTSSSLLIAPGQHFVETYDYLPDEDSCLRPGDSGSWVMCEGTGEVYGHVVSIDMFGEAYVMPLSHTLNDIGVHLQADHISLQGYYSQNVVSKLAKLSITSQERSATSGRPLETSVSQVCRGSPTSQASLVLPVKESIELQPVLRLDDEIPEASYSKPQRQLRAAPIDPSDSGYDSLFEPSYVIIKSQDKEELKQTPETQSRESRSSAPERASAFRLPNLLIRRRPPKVFCDQCDEYEEGFSSDHELDRHRDAKHQDLITKWICIDPSEAGRPGVGVEVKTPLNKCKACKAEKRYGAHYNAAAHLRRVHFKQKQGESYGPSMHELKNWIKKIYVSKEAEEDELALPAIDGDEDHPAPRHSVTTSPLLPSNILSDDSLDIRFTSSLQRQILQQHSSIEDGYHSELPQDPISPWIDESMGALIGICDEFTSTGLLSGDTIIRAEADAAYAPSLLESYSSRFITRGRSG
ncbi:hypothetical protein HD806DRAFT_494615 [Xylariaceae sp. AK1471]|nr:hypothetical protein HD806DRAFT_494615 [Xylariaceae sp. AK1471]